MKSKKINFPLFEIHSNLYFEIVDYELLFLEEERANYSVLIKNKDEATKFAEIVTFIDGNGNSFVVDSYKIKRERGCFPILFWRFYSIEYTIKQSDFALSLESFKDLVKSRMEVDKQNKIHYINNADSFEKVIKCVFFDEK